MQEKIYSTIKYDIGTILFDEVNKESFEVIKCVNLLTEKGEKFAVKGYGVTIKKLDKVQQSVIMN